MATSKFSFFFLFSNKHLGCKNWKQPTIHSYTYLYKNSIFFKKKKKATMSNKASKIPSWENKTCLRM